MKERAKKTITGTAIVLAAFLLGLAAVTWLVSTEEKQYNNPKQTENYERIQIRS